MFSRKKRQIMKKTKAAQSNTLLTDDEKGVNVSSKTVMREWKKEGKKKKKPLVDVSFEKLMTPLVNIPEWRKGKGFTERAGRAEFDNVSSFKLLVFRVAENNITKNKWESLPQRSKEIFKEVLDLFPNKKRSGEYDGCYSFSYADSENISLSIVFMISRNKAALFYSYLNSADK